MKVRVPLLCVLSILVLGTGIRVASAETNGVDELRQGFLKPPDQARIMMRWWWFGTGVNKPEMERELRVMKAAGIGGVEIQPVYPVELDDPAKDFRNLPYPSDDFLDALRFAATTVRQLGMRIDITLGSGWPFGGPHTPVTEAAARLRCDRVSVSEGVTSIAVPAMENGETLIAAFLASGDPNAASLSEVQKLTDFQNGRVRLPASLAGGHVVLFFISSRTGQQVKRPAVGAEGFVLDHYDRQAIEHHLAAVGDRLMTAFGSNPPYAVFSDSLEVFGTDWTPDFLQEFQKRRGYDLTPYLPALAGDVGPSTLAVRHDWGKTLTELAEDHYLTPIREWAHAHHTLFRSQSYGEPPVILSSNALADLPEGEHGPAWRTFSAARWASSASHLYGRPVTSSETWTWLHSPAFRATPLDMKAEADLHFIQGINQLIGHGWPYSPASAGEPGWRFYAAAAFNDHNPWFEVMPQVTQYLQRISYLMRQGKPANDIAVYLPTDDTWAQFTLRKASVDRAMEGILGANLIPQILNAGYNFDFIDDRAMAAVGIPYKMVILPGVERISPESLRKLATYVEHGGMVVATRRLPSLAPGLQEQDQSATVQELAHRLLGTGAKNARFVPDELMLGSALAQLLTPDFATDPNAAPAVGFVHRALPEADVYFVVNTSNRPLDTEAHIRVTGRSAEWWDPFNGEAAAAECESNRAGSAIRLKLAPYESRVLFFSKGSSLKKGAKSSGGDGQSIDLSTDWQVTFPPSNLPAHMAKLHSWTDDEATRYYSGQATYERAFEVPDSLAQKAGRLMLDFGPGTPVPPSNRPEPGLRALLESPVREEAVVYLNGKSLGTVWHPPYELDATGSIHAGRNELRIVVGSLAINEMAGQAPPTYHLLTDRYGERFVPQGMENLQPLPSGLLGPIRLVAR